MFLPLILIINALTLLILFIGSKRAVNDDPYQATPTQQSDSPWASAISNNLPLLIDALKSIKKEQK